MSSSGSRSVFVIRRRAVSPEDAISTLPNEFEDGEARRLGVDEAGAGLRLDQFLGQALAGEFSRSRLQALIEEGQVRLNGEAVRLPKRKVSLGDAVEIALPEPIDADPQPEAIALEVLFEDDSLIVIDKPAGLVVHPGPGNWTGTLVNALLHHCGDTLSGIGGVKRPGIVHRLDKDTSGVMVVAKSDAAHRSLAEQFAAHGRDGRMERAYRAFVWGVPVRPAGRIDAPLGRATADRTKRQVVPAGRSDAREAATLYEVVARGGNAEAAVAEVECILETGRTHQIRVHMAHIGHPLIGDELYGAGFRTKARKLEPEAAEAVGAFHRQALHAFRLGFEHPLSGEPLLFETALPEDMARLREALALKARS